MKPRPATYKWEAFLFSCLLFGTVSNALAQDHLACRDYGGAADAAQYSALSQIDRSNVGKLAVAWTYPTGDNHQYLFNPIVIDGLMYVMAKNNSIVALNAANGKEIWSYTPPPET